MLPWVRPGVCFWGKKERTAPFGRTLVARESIASIDQSGVDSSCCLQRWSLAKSCFHEDTLPASG